MDPNVIFVFVAVFGFVIVAGLGVGLAGGGSASGGARATKRMQAVATTGRAETSRAGRSGDAAANRRKQILLNLRQAEQQERKAKLTLEARILRAGLTWSVRTFWIVSAALGLGGAVVLLIVTHMPLPALGAGVVTGLGLPRWWLSGKCKKRGKMFTSEFPNAIDIIVRGIKSGLPVNDCLRVIASESPEPVGGEFRRMVENLSGGVALDQAMERMYARMPLPEVRFFAIVLAIQQKTGGNLAEALGNLSTVLRARKLMREKIKALSGEAVASAGIIGSLPPAVMLLVTVVSPGYMTPLFFTPGGHFALGVGVVMMTMGVLVMRKMINFKI